MGNVLLGNQRYSLMAVATFSRIMHPAALHKLFGNGLRNMTKSSKCCPGLRIPQISIRSNICGMCWNTKSDPRWFHPTGSPANVLEPGTTGYLDTFRVLVWLSHGSAGQSFFGSIQRINSIFGGHNVLLISIYFVSKPAK